MTRRRSLATGGAVALFAATVAMATGWMTMALARPTLPGVRPVEVGDVPFVLAFVTFCGVGAVIAAHRGGNTVGWLLLAAGMLQIGYVFTQEYAIRSLVLEAGLPAGDVAAWVAFNISPLGFAAFPLLLLVFPTGRPPSPRWNWVVWVTAAAAAAVAGGAVTNWPARGVEMLASEPTITSELADTLFLAAMAALSAAVLLGCLSLIVRASRGGDVERMQLKWMALAAGLVALVVLLDSADVLGQGDPLWLAALAAAGVASVPVAALIAVTRYRLYEIDRVISRTVSYVALTALLVGLYLGSVTLLTAVTAPATGDSPLAVAAATLLAAAAFQPARRRIQAGVDRRFNRARYDAARTIDVYRGRLRNELDLTTVADGLVATVQATVEPARVSVWLREGAR